MSSEDPDYVPRDVLRGFVPADYPETKRNVLWNGLRALKRIHADLGWEDWQSTFRS